MAKWLTPGSLDLLQLVLVEGGADCGAAHMNDDELLNY